METYTLPFFSMTLRLLPSSLLRALAIFSLRAVTAAFFGLLRIFPVRPQAASRARSSSSRFPQGGFFSSKGLQCGVPRLGLAGLLSGRPIPAGLPGICPGRRWHGGRQYPGQAVSALSRPRWPRHRSGFFPNCLWFVQSHGFVAATVFQVRHFVKFLFSKHRNSVPLR